jgi:hypothetical protein
MQAVVEKSLRTLAESCSRRGWDGKSAQPIPRKVFASAVHFFSQMPKTFPSPSLSATSCGVLIAEWGGSNSSSMRIKFGSSDAPSFEARVGTRKKSGVLPDPEYFASILKKVLKARK